VQGERGLMREHGWLQIQADGELAPEPRFVLTTA
jgi:hypothetical protein